LKKISTVRKTNKHEHGEEKLQMKKAYLCTQASGSSLFEELRYFQKIFNTAITKTMLKEVKKVGSRFF